MSKVTSLRIIMRLMGFAGHMTSTHWLFTPIFQNPLSSNLSKPVRLWAAACPSPN